MANETKFIISAVDNTRAAIESAKAGIGGLSSTISAMPGLAGWAAPLAALAGGAAIKTLVSDTIAWAAGMDDLAEKTGASVGNLSALEKVAMESGIEMAQVETGLIRLSKSLSGADEEANAAGRALAFLGLKAADLRAMDSAEALKLVADRMSEYGNGSGKTALALDIFGKSGAQLLPLLNDLAEKTELTGTLTDAQAASAEQLEKAWSRLSAESSLFTKSLAVDLIPTLASVMDFISATKTGIAQFGASLAVVANDMITFGQVSLVALGSGFTTEGQTKIKEIWAERGRFVDAANEDMENRLMSFQSLRAKIDATLAGDADTRSKANYAGSQGGASRPGKRAAAPTETDPLTESARAYAKTMGQISSAEMTAEKSTRDLNQAQSALFELMSSADWKNMPKPWQDMAVAQTAAASEAIEVAARQKRINDLIAATPTAKLEESRQAMAELRDAFEAGTISAEQFSEAAGTRLGTLPEIAKESASTIEMVISNAFQGMGDALADFVLTGKASFSDLVNAMIRDLIRLEVQTQMTSAVKSAGGTSGILGSLASIAAGLFSGSGAGTATPTESFIDAGGLAGARASGGSVDPFKTYLVGERGPELLRMGSGGGMVIPNSAIGSGEPIINMTIINQGAADGYQATASAQKNDAGINIKMLVTKAMTDDMRDNGPITKGLSSVFGLGRSAA